MIPSTIAVPADVSKRVSASRYLRLLGYPPGHDAPPDRVKSLIEVAHTWFEREASCGVWLAEASVTEVTADRVSLVDATLHGDLIARRLGGAHAVVAVALSAGPEVDELTTDHFGDRPDLAWFVDRLAAAVVETLVGEVGAQLCQVVEPAGHSVVAPLSPGCTGWTLDDQAVLHGLVAQTHRDLPVQLLASGGLTPRNSLLAVYGLTEAPVAWQSDPAVRACGTCALPDCAYRRTA